MAGVRVQWSRVRQTRSEQSSSTGHHQCTVCILGMHDITIRGKEIYGWGKVRWGWGKLEVNEPQAQIVTDTPFSSQQFMGQEEVRHIWLELDGVGVDWK